MNHSKCRDEHNSKLDCFNFFILFYNAVPSRGPQSIGFDSVTERLMSIEQLLNVPAWCAVTTNHASGTFSSLATTISWFKSISKENMLST